jgi:hypothetical protein
LAAASSSGARDNRHCLAAGAGFARAGLIDCQGPPLKLFVVEVFDCFLGLFRIAHLDEAKTAGFARGAIEDDID